MKTERKIFLAFILNLVFSAIEFVGGVLTGSVAIASDAVHDLGDALSIGSSYFLEKKSNGKPDGRYTYGYRRFSVLGGFITTVILVVGSVFVIYGAISRLINPIEINYNGMIIFAVFGVLVNGLSAFFTRGKGSINQRAVNLHMFEDVLGWVVVLVGAVVIKFTGWLFLDAVMSIGVAFFVLINAVKNLGEIGKLFLVKTPDGINAEEILLRVKSLDGVLDAHHIHVWSLDGESIYATLHVVADNYSPEIKKAVKEELKEFNISHSVVEFEQVEENCEEIECVVPTAKPCHHHHHHH